MHCHSFETFKLKRNLIVYLTSKAKDKCAKDALDKEILVTKWKPGTSSWSDDEEEKRKTSREDSVREEVIVYVSVSFKDYLLPKEVQKTMTIIADKTFYSTGIYVSPISGLVGFAYGIRYACLCNIIYLFR